MKRGEIWIINLDPTIGAEIRKTRPVVIVSADDIGTLPLRVVAPITDWKAHYTDVPWMTAITPDIQNGLEKPSSCDAFQVRSVSVERFIRKIGSLDSRMMKAISISLAEVLDIE
jgi:mRNA interferase MazF